ncbi:unnamed protein product [Meganyctiphanes norvegica]|uniref:Uncharacterized protein n=1 Tax=Meganyctiphanes norvegica TaxID=48144 RepID=A0AAV2PU23_MEGNR
MCIFFLSLLWALQVISASPLSQALGEAYEIAPGLVQEVALNAEERTLEVIHDEEDKVQGLPLLLNKKVTDREMRAIIEQNCSVAYLTFHDEVELKVPNAEAACVVALWFQGEYPGWMETMDLVKEMAAADNSQINELAKQVCPCGVIDIDAECPKDVLDAMSLISNNCRISDDSDTNLIRFWSETNNGILEIDEESYRDGLT